MFAARTPLRTSDVIVRAAIVGLALATGYIHFTLGGLLFTLNAVGYAVAAVAMIVPLALAVRFRWVVRVGLMGYAATAIVAWAIMGPYFTTAYIAKAIEVALIVTPGHRLRPPRRQPDRGRPPRARRLLRLVGSPRHGPRRRLVPTASRHQESHRHEAPDPHLRPARAGRRAGRLFRRVGAIRRPAAPAGSPSGDAVTIAAKDMKFVPTAVSVKAGTAVRPRVRQPGRRPAQHRDLERLRRERLQGRHRVGPKVTYAVPALTAGTYGFICEVHPDMKGTITAQ